jgi:hypothetical protein
LAKGKNALKGYNKPKFKYNAQQPKERNKKRNKKREKTTQKTLTIQGNQSKKISFQKVVSLTPSDILGDDPMSIESTSYWIAGL